uniref:Uncharacterized protein n=1 Tax=Arundo donax TaxID=35708 RepID=A0A0A8ZJK2_ARUDO
MKLNLYSSFYDKIYMIGEEHNITLRQ